MTTTTPVKPQFPPLLPALWLVVMLNMLLADILSLYIPGAQQAAVEFAGQTPISRLMLISAAVMELPILMILLTRVVRPTVGRGLSIAVALLCIAFVIGGGVSYPHYLLIATVEVVCLLIIIWQAWQWPTPPAAHANTNG